MELNNVRQRSASHGSLQSSSRGPNRARSQTNPRPGSRRPLRDVNENAHLLRSPGPLESMLKTTTETGDIGIYTIAPQPFCESGMPSCPQPSTAVDENIPRTPRRGETGHCSDDRKRLPSSYRDTTSEILSLYGSDIFPPCSRSLSPSVDESQRSYSLTTCSSRRAQSQKSSATLQSQSSSIARQRPRSPFAYPARLKRSDMRPASPALTKNGAVDYSRMVELDRVSQRTTYGSYRPTYATELRRPHPFSLHSDANGSTMSLPSRSSPAPHPTWSSAARSRTPSSHLTVPDPDRRGSNVQTVRSASLTSIVQMYDSSMKTGSSRFHGSFYYDYTEGFEENIPPVEPAPPLCPIPQRVKQPRPSVILTDEFEDHLREAETATPSSCRGVINQPSPGSSFSFVKERHGSSSPDPAPLTTDAIDSLEESCSIPHDLPRIAKADNGPTHPVVLEKEGSKEGSKEEVSPQKKEIAKPEALDRPEPQAPNVYSETKVTIISRKDANQDLEAQFKNRDRRPWRRSKTLPSMSELRKLAEINPTPEPNFRNLSDPIESRPSEFATLLTSLDRLGKAALPNIEDDIQHSSDSAGKEDEQSNAIEKNGKAADSETISGKSKEEREFQKRHRRNLAALRISTTGLGGTDSKPQNVPRSSEEIPILSPEPISPARELRVKDSIPQLMKALPPLPGSTGPNLAENQEHMVDAPPNDSSMGSNMPSVELTEVNFGSSPARHTSPQKFKLKVRRSLTQDADCQGQPPAPSSTNGISPAPASASPGRKRLKIKISRTQLGKGLGGCQGTVVRSPALKQCNSLADLEYSSRRDMFTKPNYMMDQSAMHKLEGARPALSTQVDNDDALASPLWDAGDLGINCLEIAKSLELKTPSLISPVNEIQPGETRSMSPHEIKPREHGLRQKISLFHLRLGSAPSKKCKRAPTPLPFSSLQEMSGYAQGMTIDHQMLNPPNEIASKRSGRVGIRVRKWARGAKRVVRSCVKKKKLDS
ncbi:unnamed protein product [Clonostachys byssicola]|uniref:Uncharacterized protein n=1 Tax=Clonostachys byssicola TaxID=160290 RepID=A0A9N9TYN5_9HYPO|nr:unnamed protein product [Clonostachys byssicola]